MIYIDSSVALARLLLEPRSAPEELWKERLISSRLLEYEIWNRVHAYGLTDPVRNEAQALLLRVGMVEMTRSVLARALEPLPMPLRTLESLHLATLYFLRERGEAVELASYDARLVAAAHALGMPLAAL